MPAYLVTVTRERTITSTTEIEVNARDEESAQTKIEERIEKAQAKPKGLDAFDWEETGVEDEFEYEANEA